MKNEKYTVEKIVQEFYGQSMTEDEGFIAPDFFAMAREIFNLRAERDALRKDNEVLSEEVHMQLMELGMKRIGDSMSQYFRADDECDTCDALRKDVEEKIRIENERDEWKMKYEAAVEHNRRLRAYNESLVPLIEAAQVFVDMPRLVTESALRDAVTTFRALTMQPTTGEMHE